MSTGRKLQPGDNAITDFNGAGTLTNVKILKRIDGYQSQSRIAFQVAPKLKNSHADAWIDADWFEQTPNVKLTGGMTAERGNDGRI